ncbi:MAG: tetratricopeptide repeat protein [Planctomycetaceae bacterium]|jgi:tetratricopeptide (TPR) repeat protein|nr:tetratricopeptide repeat protein [Planctomycetaceae bacterium]
MALSKNRDDEEDEKLSKRQNRLLGENDEDEGGESARGFRALFLRAQSWARPRRLFVTIFATAATALGLGCLIISLSVWVMEMRRPTEEMAVHAMDFGAFENARQYAQSVLRFAQKNETQKRRTAAFVYGVATCELVDQSRLRDKKPFYKNAADALAESEQLGFIPGREADGYYYLGKSQLEYGNYTDAVKNLETALLKNSPRKKNIAWYLANAYYSSPNPDLGKSLDYLQRFDELPPALKVEQQNAAMLRVFVYVKQKRIEDAERGVAQVPETQRFIVRREFALGEIARLQAAAYLSRAERLEQSTRLGVPKEELRLLEKEWKKKPIPSNETESLSLRIETIRNIRPPTIQPIVYVGEENADEKNNLQSNVSKEKVVQSWRTLNKQRLQEAIRHFENVKTHDSELLEWYRKAAFQEAHCYEQLGDYDRAQLEYKAVARTFPGAPEAIAAQFRWGYIEHIIRNNPQDGLASLELFFQMLDQHNAETGARLPVSDMTQVGITEIQRLINKSQFEMAEEILFYFQRLLAEEMQARLFSSLYSQWGDQIAERAEGKPLEERRTLDAEAQKKYQLAGKWYRTLSQWTFAESEYLTNVWNSAEYLRKGRDFPQAITMYRQFLESDIVTRQALSRYYIGSMLFEMDAIDEAVEELENVAAAYPDDPIAEETRLALVYALEEKKEWNRAVDLLILNLNGKYAPDSEVYRNSLYELGRASINLGNHDKAVETLESAIALYPDDKRVAESHYLIAISNLNHVSELESQAKHDTLKHQQETTLQTASLLRQDALNHLQESRTLLLQQDEQIGLDSAEKRMLRNTFLLIGRIFDEMGPDHYDDAVRENRRTIARYMNHPDVLQAYLQLAKVYQHQNSSENVQKTMNQAQILFRRFQMAKAFQQDVIYSEQNWEKFLQTP